MEIASSRYWNLFSALILLASAGWIWLSKASPGSTTSGAIPAPRQGFLAPDFSLPDEHGDSVRLSALRGRPVLVNLWASWCLPCRTEMPALEKVYQDYQDEGLEILAVNAANQDSQAAALAFAKAYGLSFPILFDTEGLVAGQYRVQAFPTSFFIRPDGTIQEVVVGGPMAEALLRVRVEQLLDGPGKERP